MKIEILPSNVANMIAAGEVVQGPYSVVKEMMENSVDAGASSVTVIVSDSGRTLIRIIDDGGGMSREDAVACFERHATSKISRPEDLESIVTYGFRGEALASIAAVSEVSLRTRQKGDETGTQVEYADSRLVSVTEGSMPEGSDFSVRNLFYNVPARRKFLKSDATEFRKIISEFSRIALVHPELSLRLSHNGRDIYDLRQAQALKVRIADLLGRDIAGELVVAEADTSVVKISGYVGKPECARKTSGHQYFFVNGRFFKSPYLHKAVMKAYENLIPQGTVPSYFLFLETDPHDVDVNIHPAKTEVKFEDEAVMFQIVHACVRESLGKNSFVPSIDFDTEGVPEMPVLDPRDASPVRIPRISSDPSYNPFDHDGFENEKYPSGNDFGYGARKPSGYNATEQGHADYGKLFDNDAPVSAEDIMVADGKYIISKTPDGIRITHILRARERILYNRMIQSVAMGEILSQSMLFPVTVKVGAHGVSLIEEYGEILSTIGFDIRPFGGGSVVVNGQPAGYGTDKQAVADTVAELVCSLDESAGDMRSEMISNMAVKLAHLTALSEKGVSGRSEARLLIEQLDGCEDSSVSPYSGKKCYSIVKYADLEKLLK